MQRAECPSHCRVFIFLSFYSRLFAPRGRLSPSATLPSQRPCQAHTSVGSEVFLIPVRGLSTPTATKKKKKRCHPHTHIDRNIAREFEQQQKPKSLLYSVHPRADSAADAWCSACRSCTSVSRHVTTLPRTPTSRELGQVKKERWIMGPATARGSHSIQCQPRDERSMDRAKRLPSPDFAETSFSDEMARERRTVKKESTFKRLSTRTAEEREKLCNFQSLCLPPIC